METIAEFRLRMARQALEFKVSSARNLASFHRGKEEELGLPVVKESKHFNNTEYGEIHEGTRRHMIAYHRKFRKIYEADVKFYEGELAKL